MVGGHRFTGIQGCQFRGVGHSLSGGVDCHPTVGAVHHVQCIIILAAYFTGGQFGSVQHFVAIAESEEYAQIKTFVGERVVQTAIEFRLGVADDCFIIFVDDIIVAGQILELPHSRTNPAFITMIRHTVFQRVSLGGSVIVEIIHLIQTVGDVTVELSQRFSDSNTVRVLIKAELGFIELYRFTGQRPHGIFVV